MPPQTELNVLIRKQFYLIESVQAYLFNPRVDKNTILKNQLFCRHCPQSISHPMYTTTKFSDGPTGNANHMRTHLENHHEVVWAQILTKNEAHSKHVASRKKGIDGEDEHSPSGRSAGSKSGCSGPSSGRSAGSKSGFGFGSTKSGSSADSDSELPLEHIELV